MIDTIDADRDVQHGMDRLVINGRRVFGWGWVADRTRRVKHVELRLLGDGWEGSVPVSFGLERPDVERSFPGWLNAGSSGLVVTGFIPGRRPKRITLELLLDDGTNAQIDVTRAAEDRYSERSQRRVLTWLFQAVWRRLKRGDIRGILQRAKAQNYDAPYMDESSIAASLLPLLHGNSVCLVFDHNMGGGANHYRQLAIDERISIGHVVVLCTYNLPTLDYRVTLRRAGTLESVFRVSSFLVLECILDKANVVEMFLNSPVSFDEPLMLADWLARMRERHPAVRLVVTAHDYFAVCPSFVLLDADGKYCGIPDLAECGACLKRHAASYVALSPPTKIGPWRALWGNCLLAADEVRCFSESTRNHLMKAYPSLPRERLKVTPHVINFTPARIPHAQPGTPLVIGIMGQISVQKGALIVRDMVELVERQHPDVRVVLLGTIDVAVQSPQFRVTGSYRLDELVDRIEANGINILFFPSIWPETFSYVVSEMMALRMPIVAFDLGAPAERLRSYANARLCENVSATAALHTLLDLHARPCSESPPSTVVMHQLGVAHMGGHNDR